MKQMKLVQLSLRNFKGIKEFSLRTNGKNVKVFGDNATGKTTLFDAFTWLLFDKDSQNKKDFQIKTLDAGYIIHKIEHEVEADFDIDGKTLTLKKVFAEKWTKKRGSAKTEFTGHTTDYFVNDVPVKKTDYVDRVADIVDEDVFKLLTSPGYFNEQKHWKERRDILMELGGNITDDDVFASNKSLERLQDILNDRKLEDHKKIIAAKRVEINKVLDRIPVRIDEVNRSTPDLSGLDEKAITNQIDGLKIRVEAKEGELSRIRNGGEVSAKEKQLREIEGDLLFIKNKLNADTLEKVNDKRQAVYQIQRSIDDFKYDISDKERRIKQNEATIRISEEKAKKLRGQWNEESQKAFSFEDHQTTCPSCGQDLPAEQIETVRLKAEAHYNRQKSNALEQIQTLGKSAMAAVTNLKDENEKLQNDVLATKLSLEFEQGKLKEAEQEIESLQSSVKDVTTDATYQSKQKEAEAVKREIDALRLSVEDALYTARSDIKTLKDNIANLEGDKAKFNQTRSSKKRIEELSQQEKQLTAEFEKLEEELYLAEEFIRAKVTLLEEKINTKFKYARFKLFDTQINGGLTETCETLYDGVPYSGGLNNAARINVGLDIINTLSEHYSMSAPIFIDNSEAVTKLIDINAQVISLVVSEDDKELRVEGTDNSLIPVDLEVL